MLDEAVFHVKVEAHEVAVHILAQAVLVDQGLNLLAGLPVGLVLKPVFNQGGEVLAYAVDVQTLGQDQPPAIREEHQSLVLLDEDGVAPVLMDAVD